MTMPQCTRAAARQDPFAFRLPTTDDSLDTRLLMAPADAAAAAAAGNKCQTLYQKFSAHKSNSTAHSSSSMEQLQQGAATTHPVTHRSDGARQLRRPKMQSMCGG